MSEHEAERATCVAMIGSVAMFQMPAAQIGDELATELAQLLSLAFTDRRHRDLYSERERMEWLAAAEALHAGETSLMPQAWLARFPTLENLKRVPSQRDPSIHMFERRGALLAGHVAVLEQGILIADRQVPGAYIQEVATHPAVLGAGIASSLLRATVDTARARGCQVAALGTGIPAFYERLGWRPWPGAATYMSPAGELTPHPSTMVLPLSQRGEEVLDQPAGTPIHIGHPVAGERARHDG